MRLPLALLAAAAVASAAAAQTFATTPVCAVAGAECSDAIGCCAGGDFECRAIAGRPDGRFCLPRDEVCYALGAACDAEKACCGAGDDGADGNVECKPWEGNPEGEQQTGWFCQKKVYEENERCEGAEGFPYIVWRPCAEGLVCRAVQGGLWGKFCAPPLGGGE